ncbi:hypothetical protein GGR50DRAFT_160581 [Xylaria sp. CBS 124048]|nr:hypothetical protein GGR50DRAFT_160581 [Xylaria sp. CBS 124048]
MMTMGKAHHPMKREDEDGEEEEEEPRHRYIDPWALRFSTGLPWYSHHWQLFLPFSTQGLPEDLHTTKKGNRRKTPTRGSAWIPVFCLREAHFLTTCGPYRGAHTQPRMLVPKNGVPQGRCSLRVSSPLLRIPSPSLKPLPRYFRMCSWSGLETMPRSPLLGLHTAYQYTYGHIPFDSLSRNRKRFQSVLQKCHTLETTQLLFRPPVVGESLFHLSSRGRNYCAAKHLRRLVAAHAMGVPSSAGGITGTNSSMPLGNITYIFEP